jgi:UDP-glucose 4-epimerase
MKTRAIVTGGAGFIGSHLVELLLADGVEVVVIDDLSTGKPANLEGVKADPGFSFVQADVADLDAIGSHFEGVDWVFHLAALADIVPSIIEPRRYHHANVDGTAAVLEAARAAQVKRFVYTASSSCYGIPDEYPTPETAPLRPQYPYALTKQVGESYALHWHQVYGLPVVSLRLFNVFGVRSRTSGAYGAVMGVFLAQKLAGRPLTIVGDGSQTRDFVFVTDVAQAFLAAAKSDVAGEVFNVASSRPKSVNELAALIGGDTVHIPKRPGEPDCTWADTTKIERMLGWRPRVPFEEGVEKVLERIHYWDDAPVWTPASIEQATKEWFEHLS